MPIRALTWNVFHGRDFPPDRSLLTLRSKLLRITERSETHAQVNRGLTDEFIEVICAAEWDVALLQECPPRWQPLLARACAAQTHRVLTSRNSCAPLRRLATRINPDLIGSNEGGSNLTLVRPTGPGEIAERRELVLCRGPFPERRTLGFVRLAGGLCVANLHASTGPSNRKRAEAELLAAAARCTEWAAGAPLIFGGDLNVLPRDSHVYSELEARFALRNPTDPTALDHLLSAGLDVVEPPSPWPPEHREVARRDGLLIRLSDHTPVVASFDRRS